MDLKKIISIVIAIFLGTLLFLVAMIFFFHADIGEGNVVSNIGNTAIESNFKEAESESNTTLTELQNTDPPEVDYVGFTCITLQEYYYKDLIMVKPAGSNKWYSGSEENGFIVSLVSVLTAEGESIFIGKGDEGAADEVAYKVHVNITNGTIVFNERGVYRLGLKVYGTNGRFTYVEVKVPVED